ncbi:Citrate transporter [Thermoanaerobacter mathranii subsp. mathranii str. A3]|uniref:Citrate transporter n=1 Tax=Thermoanaerobacter mathranii subsp. mathranii (strain DSM 11426 / CCUG 53645 / CIP 108742 / A3) TaxID=583358 RepID=A0ABN3YZM0_THEM3|nr:C4-dicarboxylate ABC transporter [Thermoanaerobacter mathranii]ADH60287.1 Citrate transporter [Thermoanaerobacter mathranii subsp. mathranii str. A3]
MQAVLILVLFLAIAVLMITRKLPTLIALPILAIGIAVIAGVPLKMVDPKTKVDNGLLAYVIDGGAIKLAAAYVAVMFGAWLGQIMNQTGISKSIVKTAAELGGDRPFIITILVAAAIALLFTTVGGLGAVIMIGSITIPILMSVGVAPMTAIAVFLFGMAIGLELNMGNWAFYITATGVTLEQVRNFALVLMVLTAITALVFIIIEFKRQGLKFAWAQANDEEIEQKANSLALLTPLIPILFVLVFKWSIISSFMVGIVYSVITTQKSVKNALNTLTKTAYDGIADSAPAVLLMIGIGMLLNAVMHPMVAKSLEPILKSIIPSSRISYIIFFSLLAPLALYRGPLNLWGLGSGIAGLIIGLKLLPPTAVMGALLSTERIQAIGDPTNTHNVWLSNYAGVDVNKLLLKLLPYIWALAIAGVVTASIMFF